MREATALRGRAGAPDGETPRSSDDVLERSNLSTSQFLLWLGQRLHADSPLYNMVLAFDITGPLEPAHFARAFSALASGSDALRTVFDEDDGIPRQRVRSSAPNLEHVDLSGDADAAGKLRAFLHGRATIPFDLRDRLVDTVLVRLSPERHVWYLNQHHLITDAWATALVYRSVADLYLRSLAGTLNDAPPPPPYAAYVEHERRFRGTPTFRRVREHWQQALDAATGPVRLYGHDADRAGTRTHRLTVDLGAQRTRRIHDIASRLGAGALTGNTARFDLFSTALFAYLHRVSGKSAIAFGTPAHNRASTKWKETIGPFIELFPMTAEIDASDTFVSLLERVQAESRRFLRYAQPGASSPALMRGFNVVLNYIHASFPDFAGLPMRSEWIHAGHGDSRHHLRLQVQDFDSSGSIVLHFDFNSDVLDGPAQQAATGHFMRVLDALLEAPELPIGSVDLLTPEARRQVLQPVSASPVPAAGTVVDMIRAQAMLTPDAIALSYGDLDLTYAQLLHEATQLARLLRARDVTAESRVGIYLERSPEAVIAVLGVMLAGGAYVPLAPDDPAERTEFVLRDADIRLLVTDAAGERRLPRHAATIVRIDEVTSQSTAAKSMHSPGPGEAVYVLYTSGSTGRPKGVVVEHASLARYVAWAREYYLHGSPLDFPLFTSLSFDLTVTSIFLPLVSGGRVVVQPPAADAAATLLRVLEDDRVDAIKLTPSHLALLAGADLRSSRVRLLIVGGEDLKRGRAIDAQHAFGDVEIHNEYGPTEATVGCMIHRFDVERDTAVSVPIGRAAADARIYVLDAGMNPVPAGVAGEIFIGGPGVARGYLNRPDLTAERFLADPFAAGGRLYRTGDLGRWRTDGVLQFLGRTDDQLKVRGARIEPAEVETALLDHPAILACAVATTTTARDTVEFARDHCATCGLPSSYPGVSFDGDGVCHLCRGFPAYRERVARYFRSMDDLRAVFDRARTRRRGEHDCVMLLSGGKDSTYALSRLVEMGVSVLAFTLDNGYISEGAKANIRRVTEELGVDHVFGTTPAMNAIFVDSLRRHANVCDGCFKTIYTLGVRVARERGIPIVVTGLSRGQFFETRLTEELFRDDRIDVDHIDRMILEARKAYHRTDDALARLLNTREFQNDGVFDEIEFVDFYRYCDVELGEMLRYLAERVPWIRPADTGRSTNCLINEVGIFVHRRRRGFHNYAFPYSWDVRIGHKTRDDAIGELNDEPDPRAVHRILREIGFDEAVEDTTGVNLAAFVVSDEPIAAAELRTHLARTLPSWMIPTRFIRLDRLPLTPHGKVDRAALRALADTPSVDAAEHVGPRTAVESRIAAIWSDVLGLERIGVLDGFLDLGGNSLLAIRIISRVNDAFGIDLPLGSAFEASTVASLAALAEDVLVQEIGALSDAEAARQAGRIVMATPPTATP